jgi:hypothetical protein
VALFFHYDIVKLDLFGEEHPTRRLPASRTKRATSSEPAPDPMVAA